MILGAPGLVAVPESEVDLDLVVNLAEEVEPQQLVFDRHPQEAVAMAEFWT